MTGEGKDPTCGCPVEEQKLSKKKCKTGLGEQGYLRRVSTLITIDIEKRISISARGFRREASISICPGGFVWRCEYSGE